MSVIAVATVLGLAAPTRPGFDPYGWLVWGHMTWHGGLDTNAAPSWKPLPYLFTLPESLLGTVAVRVWTITAIAGALAAVALAARLTYRLSPASSAPAVRWAATGLAALGVLCLHDESATWLHYTLSAQSDPMVVACGLGAAEAWLAGRARAAFALLALAGLGRPETWPIELAAAVPLWRRAGGGDRPLVMAALAASALLWFGIPALTARSWLVAFDNALGFVDAPHAHPVGTVLSRFVRLAPWPLEVSAAALTGWGAWRREMTVLTLAAAIGVWVAVEAGLALHGLPGLGRYMFEPAAVTVVLGAVGAARVTKTQPRPVAAGTAVAALAVVVITAVLAAAQGRDEAHDLRVQRERTLQVDALRPLVDRLGGPPRIRACGETISRGIGTQTLLAWTVGENVSAVGYRFPQPGHPHNPVVLFSLHGDGWRVRALRQTTPGCRRIQRSGRSG